MGLSAPARKSATAGGGTWAFTLAEGAAARRVRRRRLVRLVSAMGRLGDIAAAAAAATAAGGIGEEDGLLLRFIASGSIN